MEQIQQQQQNHTAKKKSKLQKFRTELSKSNELITEIELINRKLDEMVKAINNLLSVDVNIETLMQQKRNELHQIVKENSDLMPNKLASEIETHLVHINEIMVMTKELKKYLKNEKKITKMKVDENTTIRNNFSTLLKELVAKFNSLVKTTGEGYPKVNTSEIKNEGENKRKRNDKTPMAKISHSLFNIYDEVKSTSTQKHLKDSKKKSDTNKKKKRKVVQEKQDDVILE